MAIIPGMENINWFGLFTNVGAYLTYAIVIVAMFVIGFILFYYTGFKVKAETWDLYGSGKDGIFSVGKSKKNRLKWINNKTAWRPMYPLMNKLEIEPFDSEFIYPGNQVYAFLLNGTWTPGRLNINQSEDELRCEINPVPYSVRNWQSLEHKKNAFEYAQQNFWEMNKMFIYTAIVVAICCAVAVATIWLTYKFAAPGTEAMNNLASSIQSLNVIPGK